VPDVQETQGGAVSEIGPGARPCDSGFHGPFLIHPGGVSRRALDADVAPHLRGLIISQGDPTVFLTRPVSLTLLILAVIAFAIAVLPTVRRRREAVFEEEV
jgi:hypothetical protein